MIKIAGLIILLCTLIIYIASLTHPETIALAGGTVIDVLNFRNSNTDLEDTIGIVEREMISVAGSRDSITIPEGAQIINIRGSILCPA